VCVLNRTYSLFRLFSLDLFFGLAGEIIFAFSAPEKTSTFGGVDVVEMLNSAENPTLYRTTL
jgi:hypothetical protein